VSRSSTGLSIAAGVALVACATLVLGLAVIGGIGQGSTSASVVTIAQLTAETCTVTGPIKGLTAAQAANADAIVSAAMAASDESARAARMALMTAMTESGLLNLDHGDQDSLGLFQQRPSQGGGTPAQIMDPTYATDAFVVRLLSVPNWQQIAPWLAAQDVQHSADADGSNYEANWVPAGTILAEVVANGDSPGDCGQGTGGLAGGGTGHGLPSGYVVPAGTPPLHTEVVNFVVAQLGKSYVWGGAGPAAYDCSGLTMAAWASVGVALAHASSIQQTEGAAVSATELVPGDLVLVPGSDSPGPGLAGHVGIYLGDGLVLSAIDTQYGVAVQTWDTFVSGGLIALRDPAPGE
jgi:cell wall-associated NlpC family hydrolase